MLGPVLFLVLISDISSNVSSNITSFADDIKVFAIINDPTDCDNLQSDLDNIYSWSSENNMMFNQEKFQYISYHMGDSSKINNVYLSPDLNVLPKSGEVKDLGILMSENCEFDNHIATVVMKCSRLCGWIFANLFHAFQASPVNFVQVISDNPIWTMAPNYGPLFK